MRFATPSLTGSATLRSAGTLVWDGGQGTANWDSYTATAANQSNWNLNNIPLAGDALQFAGTAQTTTTNNITGLSVASITFNSGAGAFTNGGANSVTVTGAITNSSSNLQTINHGVVLSSGAHTVDATGASVALGGVVSGGGSINKTGNNRLTLSGANTFTGGTTVTAGSILVSNAMGSSATGTGSVTVGTTGSLLGAGFINAGANLVTIGGTLSPGTGTGSAGTINIASTSVIGALTLASTSTLAFDITSLASKDLVALGGSSLLLSGGTLALNLPNLTNTGIDYTGVYALFTGVSSLTGTGFGIVTGYDNADYTPVFALNGTEYDLSFSPTAVPEPATIFGGLLIAGVAVWNQRRRVRGLFAMLMPSRAA